LLSSAGEEALAASYHFRLAALSTAQLCHSVGDLTRC
jgi:hypothetical protein